MAPSWRRNRARSKWLIMRCCANWCGNALPCRLQPAVEIHIPRGGVWLLGPGMYDIDAGAPDRPARVAVYEGSARFTAGTVEVAIKAGEVAVLNGKDPVVASIERAASDEFAQWRRSRD